MPFNIQSILEIDNPHDYKFHAARWNGETRPLDVFTRDREEWVGWNRWRGQKDDFNRRYIVSFIDFYPEDWIWLFGGIFEVTVRQPVLGHSYEIMASDKGANLVGRLKIRLELGRGRSFRFENLVANVSISEVLREPYSGEPFVGFDSTSLDFSMLETIIKNERLDWKTALQHVKGIYLIVDKSTGKKYVGSAYNEVGIWSRWSAYVATGHGWNVALMELIAEKGIGYARENFRITLLETWPSRTEDKVVQGREVYWKGALLTRGDFGYNRN